MERMVMDKKEKLPENPRFLQIVLSFLPRLWVNWITISGSVMTTLAACTIIVAATIQITSEGINPYAAVFSFLFMPMVFILGLVLIPIGFLYESKRRPRPPDAVLQAFQMAVSDRLARRRIIFVILLTLVNLIILALAGGSATTYMDSVEFCGRLCHSVMAPEFNAYQRSPHSRVKCVECHIGEGATWMVKSKISGLRQVWSVLTGSYHRPVPSPVEQLRPARDTCERCHWPAKFHGNRLKFFEHFEPDDRNSRRLSVLLLKVGGEDAHGRYRGIHWHVSPEIEIRFQPLDRRREKIGKVAVYRKGRLEKTFNPAGQEEGSEFPERTMDCVDCHNRPTHAFALSPAEAVEEALAAGHLDASVPYLRSVAEQLLALPGLDHNQIEGALLAEAKKIYAERHPEITLPMEKLKEQIAELAAIYRRNVYPELFMSWGTHANHIGHRGGEKDRRGCFRCHDDQHTTENGESISQDCDLCHQIIVEDSEPDALADEIRSLWLGD
jgi:hypothetical protein